MSPRQQLALLTPKQRRRFDRRLARLWAENDRLAHVLVQDEEDAQRSGTGTDSDQGRALSRTVGSTLSSLP
jgi:hypothetical protein